MAVVGWILLGIVLLLLFLLLTVLFLPICYRVIVKMDQNGLSVKAKGNWFFHLIRVYFDYPEPKKPIIKIAWFTLSKKKEKNKNPKKKKEADSEKNEAIAELTAASSEQIKSDDIISEENSSEENASAESIPEESKFNENSDKDASFETNPSKETASEEPPQQETSSEAESDSKDNGKKKKKEKKPFKETIQKLLDDFRYYKELWEDGNTKPFVKDALSRVLHILKNLMPRKIKGYVLFGAASPDITGYVFGAYSVCSTLYPKRFFITLEPDFEKKVLEGDLIIKGHFCIFTLLFDGLRILFDKRLKLLRKKLDARKNPEKAEQENSEGNSKRKRRHISSSKRKAENKRKTKQKTENIDEGSNLDS